MLSTGHWEMPAKEGLFITAKALFVSASTLLKEGNGVEFITKPTQKEIQVGKHKHQAQRNSGYRGAKRREADNKGRRGFS